MSESRSKEKSGQESGAESSAEILCDEPIQVVPVELNDVSAIIRIDAEITGEAKADYWYSQYVRQNTDTTVFLLVGRRNDQVAGYVLGSIQAWEFGSPPCGWVEAISVNPTFRRKQIATQLFDAAVAYFHKSNIATVRTMVHVDAHDLISFFRMQGMTAGPYIELEMRLD